MLSSKKAKKELFWEPRLTFDETIKMTVDWYKYFFANDEIEKITERQIEYFRNK